MTGTSSSTPSEPAALASGQNAQAAVGNTADVVGRTASSFFQAVTGAMFMNTIFNVAQDQGLLGARPMAPGQDFGSVLGSSAEAFGKGVTPLMNASVTMMADMGIATGLFKLGSMDTFTQPERQEMQAQDDIKKAEFVKQDAATQEAQVQEDQRRAFFAAPPKM